MFLQHFAVKGVLNQGCRIEQIFTIVYTGDKNMRKWLENWTDILADPAVNLDDESKRRLLIFKLQGSAGAGKKSEAMVLDLQHMDRMEHGDPDCTHAWIIGRMYRWLERQRDDANEAAYNKQLGEMYGTGACQPGSQRPFCCTR